MAINLSGLMLADVEIFVQGDGIIVRTGHEDCIQDLLSLPLPIKVFESRKGVYFVDPHGTDTIAFAERLATTWEARGYKITRKVAPLHSMDSKEVQSFILA